MASLVLKNALRPAYTSGKAMSEHYKQQMTQWSAKTEASHQETLQVVEEAKQQMAARALQDQKLEVLVKALCKDRAERKAECAALRQQLDTATKAAEADQAEMMCLRQHIAQQDEELEDLRAQIVHVSREAHMQAFKMVSARQQREAAQRREQAEEEAMLRQMFDENDTLGREIERMQACMDQMKAEHAAILEGVMFTTQKADWSWEECCGNGEQGEETSQNEQPHQAAEQQLAKMQQALEQQLAEARQACAQQVAEVRSAAEQQLQQMHEAAEQRLAAERSAAEQRVAEAHRAAQKRVAEVQQAALQQAEELRVLRQAAAQQAGRNQGDSATHNLQAIEGAAETHLHPSCAGKMTGKDQQQVGKLLLQQALKAALAPQRSAGSNSSSSSDGEETDSENGSSTGSASSSQQGWGGWGGSSSNSSPLYISRSSSSCRPRWCIDWANLPVPCDGWGSVRYSWENVPVPCDGW